MRRALALAALALAACTGPGRAAAPATTGAPTKALAAAAGSAWPTRAVGCRPASARRCGADGCEDAGEGLHAEAFDFDVEAGTVGACLYTDCFAGPARVVREPDAPWRVTLLGVVRSDRPEDGVPPPGSAPFPLTVSVDLRDGRFTATWALSPDGLQADFGTCALRGP